MIIHDEYTISNMNCMNCIHEELVPTQYFEKTTQTLSNASGRNMKIKYKLNKVQIYNKRICIPTTFLLVKDLSEHLILGTPFLAMLMSIKKN